MIVRIWKAVASAAQADAYPAYFADALLPKLRQIEGCAGARLLRRSLGEQVEFMVLTHWTSWDAVKAFAGADPEVAVVEPEAQAMLVRYDRQVQHFELMHET